MSNKAIIPTHAVTNYNPGNASLMEMRADPVKFPRLKTIPREQAVIEVAKIVSLAFLYRGQVADPTTIDFISSALVDEIIADTKYGLSCLSLAEIQIVIKRAVLGESEMFGISVASLYKLLVEFAKGEGHSIQKVLDERIDPYHIYDEDEEPDNPETTMLKTYTREFLRTHKVK